MILQESKPSIYTAPQQKRCKSQAIWRICNCVGNVFPVAVQGNNEVSMWDMETGDRRFTLWASSTPPLSELQVWVPFSFPITLFHNSL